MGCCCSQPDIVPSSDFDVLFFIFVYAQSSTPQVVYNIYINTNNPQVVEEIVKRPPSPAYFYARPVVNEKQLSTDKNSKQIDHPDQVHNENC